MPDSVSRPPIRPLLLFDGDCGFCLRWIARWRQMTGDAVNYQPYQQAAHQFPEIPRDHLEHAVHLVEPDGSVNSAAAAVFRTLYLAGEKRWLWSCYQSVPGFAGLSEASYRFVSRHRGGLDRVDRWFIGTETLRPTYFISRDLFLRLLGVIYLIAFFQYYLQADGLIGSHGILPVSRFIEAYRKAFDAHGFGIQRYWQTPTLFWINSSDLMLHILCWIGVAASCLIILGIARVFWLAIAWIVYLSLTVAGQEFLSFQWDALLLESGFIAIFLAPWQMRSRISCEYRVSRIALWLERWLLFRLMFLSGLVKLTYGDLTWRSWEVLRFHYETQPLATWTSWYIAKFPQWFHWISLVFMWVAELLAPWLIWGPRRMRTRAFVIIVLFQVLIAATGNYGFFNLLTIVLCIPLLDDAHLARRWREKLSATMLARRKAFCGFSIWVTAPLAMIIFAITTMQIIEACRGEKAYTAPLEWPQPLAAIEHVSRPIQSVNSYGLFRVMTRHRYEIVIEGSSDGLQWVEYKFKWKPGDLRSRPMFTTPLMPRLDWQMWFAALSERPPNWFFAFSHRLLQGQPEVLGLMAGNPFLAHPPKYVRTLRYEYHFTTADERRTTGAWWKRDLMGMYSPILRLEMFQDEQGAQPPK